MSGARQWIMLVTCALLLGPTIWLAALAAAVLPRMLAVEINVHGLPVPGYAGHSAQRLAPLSERIITDARRDASPSARASQPAPSASGPSLPAPTQSSLPLPVPSGPALPTPAAVPTPTALPAPSPSLPPTPSVLPGV